MTERKTMKQFNLESSEGPLLRRRTRIKSIFSNLPPPKTTCAAALFFIAGLAFLIAGAVLYWGGKHDKDKGFTFLILGGIMFVPGSYASFVLLGAWLGWPNFEYSMVPSYDD